MPGWLIFAIVFFFAGLLALVARRLDRGAAVARQERPLPVYGWAALACFCLSGLFLLVSSYNAVPTKEEGIETSFGKTAGHLSNGPHLTWPWIKVHHMDAAIQTDSYTGPNCLQVRIAN